MSTINEFADFLETHSSESHPSFKFVQVGDTLTGDIIETPRVAEFMSKFTGRMERQGVVAVQPPSGEAVSLWIKAGFMTRAVQAALQKHGPGTTLQKGGRIAVRFSGEQDTGKGNPAKMFEVAYTPPAATASAGAASVSVDDLLG